MEGADSGGIGLRLGRDRWHGGDFTFIPEMHTCATVEASTATCTARKAERMRAGKRQKPFFLTL